MPKFGSSSLRKVDECHQELQHVLHEAIIGYDFSCIWGHRNREDQQTAFENGYSDLKYPFSQHNRKPSRAFDVIPWPKGFQASDLDFYIQATYILRAAIKVGVGIKWGGHWPRKDLAHFELARRYDKWST